MSIKNVINERVKLAMLSALGLEYADPILKVSSKPEFGDYQANFAMSLAKQLGKNPRELALQVVQQLNSDDIFDKIEVAGPGFINIHVKPEFLAQQLEELRFDRRCGVEQTTPEMIVVDYGGPNVAKEMHVGHLRSTVIGDAITRVLMFVGHHVIRQNHMGDWGTQFGMLIQNMLDQDWQSSDDHSIADLNVMYQAAKQRYDSDEEFAKRARERVVLLQAGDEQTLALWRELVTESERHFDRVYKRLGVLLTEQDIKSESSYNDTLSAVVAELKQSSVASHSDGATVIYLDGFFDQDNKPLPFMIQKTDGGYLYATTDLAALKYRVQILHATRLIYVIDARQSQHMAMLFAAARKSGWATDVIHLEHAAFGSVLGNDRRPFKTRSGETIKLIDLLDEAEQRALDTLTEKKSELSLADQKYIANAISISAIKYADLSSDRVKDYVFDWNRMLSFEGNSAPYLLNAYVRIQSIFRKGDVSLDSLKNQSISVNEPAEKNLALKLLAFPEIVMVVANDLAPHNLCHYLCELAANFHAFYEYCPILKTEDEVLKQSRLALCAVTAQILQQGLNLLGIATIEHM